mmetsp:Transcript_2897/g.4568  ORF Transcript_2897/g.4568 Transcript_2897/m.4568 type:complete len:488 (-) Transcript_2897:34-1497(-)
MHPPFYRKSFSNDTRSSGISSYTDFRYDSGRLPAAGMSSKRWHERIGAKQLEKPPANLSLLHDVSALDPNVHPYTELGFTSRVNPVSQVDAAGTRSSRVHTTIHQNQRNDKRSQLQTKDRWASAAKSTTPRAMASARAAERLANPSRQEASDMAHLSMVEHPVRCDGTRAKSEGHFGAVMKQITDPITHFEHERRFDPGYYWKPSIRTGCYEHDRTTGQTWTWQQHRVGGLRAKAEEAGLVCTKKDVGTLTSCRGSHMHNIAGREDLLPAATEDYLKCERPPTRDHVLMNDRRLLPHFQRPTYSPRAIHPEFYNSGDMRDCIQWTSGRRSVSADPRTQQHPEYMRPAGKALRAVSVEPQPRPRYDIAEAQFDRTERRNEIERLQPSRSSFRKDRGSFAETSSAETQAQAILDAISALARTYKESDKKKSSNERIADAAARDRPRARARTPPARGGARTPPMRSRSARSLPSSPSQSSRSDFQRGARR